jgi:hypothetical protein
MTTNSIDLKKMINNLFNKDDFSKEINLGKTIRKIVRNDIKNLIDTL